MNKRKYASPFDFRKALEARLKQQAGSEEIALNDLRKQVTFEQFLARLDFNRYCLKGGFSLQLRLPQAVATIDIDLALCDSAFLVSDRNEQNQMILEDLKQQAKVDKGDFFEFDVERIVDSLPDAKDGGCRCVVTANIGNQYYQQFHVDVAVEAKGILPHEKINTKGILAFAGIKPGPINVVAKEEIFAEKLHAYSKRHYGENSRVKDLADMASLVKSGLNKKQVLKAMKIVFEASSAHKELSSTLQEPPKSWQNRFNLVAQERGIDMGLEETFICVADFYKSLEL